MKISIVCVGKLKENFHTDAVNEYRKRLSRYCKLDITELVDEKTPDHASSAKEQKIKEIEGERILKSLKDDSYVIALEITGMMLSSEEFASKIEKLCVNGVSHITFVIGGSLGLSTGVLTRANEQVSFSKMTFPHQLMRTFLLEQIYRGYRITNGEPYHK